MHVDLSHADDRGNAARRVWHYERSAYIGILLSRIEPTPQWWRRWDGRRFAVDFYPRINAHIEYRQPLWCDIECDDIDDQ